MICAILIYFCYKVKKNTMPLLYHLKCFVFSCPVITADLITVSGCDNMTMSDHVMPGASCTLSCPIGYETEVKQINCLASGMWDHLGALECKATCMGFATAHNYTVSAKYNFFFKFLLIEFGTGPCF